MAIALTALIFLCESSIKRISFHPFLACASIQSALSCGFEEPKATISIPSIPFSLKKFSTGIGFGIAVIFFYYLGIKMGQTFGYNQILSPFLSVWFVNILFLSLGGYIFIKTRT